MNPRLRSLIRIFRRALLLATALLLAGSAALWIFRTEVLAYLATHYLQEIGFEKPQLTLRSVESDMLVAESIYLARNGSSLSIAEIEVTFSLQELLRQGRIHEVEIIGAAATLAWPLATSGTGPPASALPSLEELSELLDPSAILPLPFDRIQITDSNLVLQAGGKGASASLEADLRALSPASLSLEARLASGDDKLAITALLASSAESSLETQLHLASPLALLDSYRPDWRSTLPELESLSAGSLDLRARLDLPADAKPELKLKLEAQALGLEHETLSARISRLEASSTLSDFTQIPLLLTLEPERLSSDAFTLRPNQPIILAITASNFSVVKILTQTPLAWDYDSGFVQGQSHVDLAYDSANATEPLVAKVETEALNMNETRLLPFTLLANGTPDAIHFRSSPIRSANFPQAAIDEGQGTLQLPTAAGDPISFAFEGLVTANDLLIEGEAAELPRLELRVATTVFDEETLAQVELTSPPAARVRLPHLAEARGGLKLHLDLTKDARTELYTGNATLDASEFSIQSESLSGDGITLQAKIGFHDLDSEPFAEPAGLDPSQLERLLEQLEVQLEWQANRLSAQGIEAKWCGGSSSLQQRDDGLHLASSLGAGILSYDTLRFEQVYMEAEHLGTLQRLAGTSRTNALIDGAALEILSRHSIQNPLGDLSLNGEYDILPITFTHTDLPARLVPELAGLALSAQLEAQGAFHASAQAADASLSLRLTEGSLDLPAYQLSADGVQLELGIGSLATLDSGPALSRLSVDRIAAGDARASQALGQFRIRSGTRLAIDSAEVSVFGGKVLLEAADIPLDGSDFQGSLALQELSLEEITAYIEIFDGKMDGLVTGVLPFRLHNGRFELLRGDLSLPEGSLASLRYDTKGLLTTEESPSIRPKPTASERLLKFLKIDPDRSAEQALGNITITRFDAQLFPEDDPETPLRITIEGLAHSELADIPVVISTQVHGSLSELYNFLIRLNSL